MLIEFKHYATLFCILFLLLIMLFLIHVYITMGVFFNGNSVIDDGAIYLHVFIQIINFFLEEISPVYIVSFWRNLNASGDIESYSHMKSVINHFHDFDWTIYDFWISQLTSFKVTVLNGMFFKVTFPSKMLWLFF